MKKIWPMLALGLGAYVLFALATLPAQLITNRLARNGVSMIGVQGTVWRGSAAAVQVANLNLGALRWSLRPLALFMARAGADITVQRSDGSLNCGVFYQLLSGRISLDKLTATLPVNALPPTVTQGGWEGTLQANFSELVLDKGWPASAKGSLQARNLIGPARKPANIGSFKISFPAARAVPNALTGDITSIDGPLRVTATLQLKAADHSYFIEGVIATDPSTPQDITRSLQLLGAPDAQGNRPFSLEGTM
jgi:general secretion pathway protein N